MPRWLMKFSVEAHLGVEPGTPALSFRHPSGRYEVHLQNLQMEPGQEDPLLSAYVLFPSDKSPVDVADEGELFLLELLDTLTFAASARFRIRHRLCLWDWTPEIPERQGIVYNTAPDPEIPQTVLNTKLTASVETLLKANPDRDVLRALRWFTHGVAAGPADQQFQMFWFAVETLAQVSKNIAKVPSRCSKCQEPLTCPKCQSTPLHRPYPSQAIEQLFKKYVQGDAESLYRMTSDMRHALLHGDVVKQVEDKYGRTLGELVDLLGRLVWIVLLNILAKDTVGADGMLRLGAIQPSTYLHHRTVASFHVAVGWTDGRELVFENIPKFDVSQSVVPHVERPTEPPRMTRFSMSGVEDEDPQSLTGEQEDNT